MPRYVTVAKEGSLGLGRLKRVFARDRRIAVFNDGGTLRAVDDTCTHVGGSLSEGLCEDGIVNLSLARRAVPSERWPGAGTIRLSKAPDAPRADRQRYDRGGDRRVMPAAVRYWE